MLLRVLEKKVWREDLFLFDKIFGSYTGGFRPPGATFYPAELKIILSKMCVKNKHIYKIIRSSAQELELLCEELSGMLSIF